MPVASLTHSITGFVGNHGVYAVFLLMLVDSVFPAASELVMVYGGALAAGAFTGQHVDVFGARVSSPAAGYVVVALAGTLGYLVGSWLGWCIGAFGGRSLVERHGRWLHLDAAGLARAEAWFERRGTLAVLLGRVTPVVRSFVSIPAGIARMPLAPYSLATLAGGAVWAFALAGVGWAVGRSYARFHHGFDYVTIAVIVVAVAAVVAIVARRRRLRTAPALEER